MAKLHGFLLRLLLLEVVFEAVQAEEATVVLVLVVEIGDASVVEEGVIEAPDGPVRKTGK